MEKYNKYIEYINEMTEFEKKVISTEETLLSSEDRYEWLVGDIMAWYRTEGWQYYRHGGPMPKFLRMARTEFIGRLNEA